MRFLQKLALLFCFICLPLAASAQTVNAVYNFAQFDSAAVNVARVVLTPIPPAGAFVWPGSFLPHTLPKPTPMVFSVANYPALTNGTITVSNLWTGYPYRVAVSDNFETDFYTNYFGTNESGTVDASTNLAYVAGAIVFPRGADGTNGVNGSGGSGGSQTPWTSDIDAAGHSLTNGTITLPFTFLGAENNSSLSLFDGTIFGQVQSLAISNAPGYDTDFIVVGTAGYFFYYLPSPGGSEQLLLLMEPSLAQFSVNVQAPLFRTGSGSVQASDSLFQLLDATAGFNPLQWINGGDSFTLRGDSSAIIQLMPSPVISGFNFLKATGVVTNLNLTGDITGSSGIGIGTVATTLKNTGTAGTYRSVTFDSQGRETSGSNPTTVSGYGLSDTWANMAAALSGTIPASEMPAFSGDITSSAGSVATTLKNTGTAGTYAKTTFDAQGRETAGASLALADLPATYNQNTNVAANAIYLTNSNPGVVIDATTRYQLFVTNASYAITGFSGLVSGEQHIFSQTVSNASASTIIVTGPPSTFYIGIVSTNVIPVAAGKEYVMSFWIWPSLRTNSMNCAQQ